jgi:hypothetical protein
MTNGAKIRGKWVESFPKPHAEDTGCDAVRGAPIL